MKGSRILIVLVVLAAIAAGAFLLLRSRPPPITAVPPQTQSAEASAPRAPAPADLGAALRFSQPATCEMAAPLQAIVDQMSRTDPETFEGVPPGPITVPGIDRPILPRFNRTRTVEGNADIRQVEITLDLPGRWHGLGVTRLLRHFTEESDSSSVEIQFAETPERVRAVLRRAGFAIGPVGEWHEVGPDEGVGMAISLSPIEGGASLVCAIG